MEISNSRIEFVMLVSQDHPCLILAVGRFDNFRIVFRRGFEEQGGAQPQCAKLQQPLHQRASLP
jgi:hypothetical protein